MTFTIKDNDSWSKPPLESANSVMLKSFLGTDGASIVATQPNDSPLGRSVMLAGSNVIVQPDSVRPFELTILVNETSSLTACP